LCADSLRWIVDAEEAAGVCAREDPGGDGEGGREAGRAAAGVPGATDEREAVGAGPVLHDAAGEGVAVGAPDAETMEEGEEPIPAGEGAFVPGKLLSHHAVEGALVVGGGGGELREFGSVVAAAGHGITFGSGMVSWFL